jgi:hypothetical protein
MKNLIGEATCRICQESFSTTITGMLLSLFLDLDRKLLKWPRVYKLKN